MSPAATGWVRAAVTLGVVTVLDQATKAAVVAALGLGESVRVAPGLELSHVRNTGVAFGAFAGSGTVVALLAGVALLGLLAWFASVAGRPRLWLPVGLLLGGAVGNLVDRARSGAVTDFIDPVAWPAFNLADSAIVVGVGLLLLVSGRERRAA